MATTVDDFPYNPDTPMPTLRVLFSYELKNVPGFSALCLEIDCPPGGSSPPHRHGGNSVVGFVKSGTVYNKMNSEPTKHVKEGESWYEAPGCHHKTFANASDEQGLVVLATHIVQTSVYEADGLASLVQVDEEWAYLQHAVMKTPR